MIYKTSIICIILVVFTSQKLFSQLPYSIWPSQDTTIEITGPGKFNTIIVDNTKDDKDVSLVIESTPSCPYEHDGAFFGVVNQSTNGHANASYPLEVSSHTTSQNTSLYRQQPDLYFIREYGSFAVGDFDADVLVKDSGEIVLREHLHESLPIELSNGGMYLISQVPAGSKECVPAFLTNNSLSTLTVTSIDDIDSDSSYSFTDIAAFPITIQPGAQNKLFDACYSPQQSANYYSRRIFVNTDQGRYTILIAGSPCGSSVGQSIWQQSGVADQTFPNSIVVFPNPASDKLHIYQDGSISLRSVELFSETGLSISKLSIDANADHIDLDLASKHLSSGSYFLRLSTDKESFVKPIVLYSR